MKLTFHLSSKNVCGVVAGVCVVILAFIPLAVPPDHWIWARWTVAVIVCGMSAVVSLVYQALVQSREDAEREERERERDKTLAGLEKSLVAEAVQSTFTLSNAVTRSVPHGPGSFDSVAFFRTAHFSALQDVAANSYKDEAQRVRPNDRESFYLDVLATGSMQMMYDNLWWISYRSQLRALSALNMAQGMMTIEEFRKPFDEAATEFPDDYARLKIKFEDWLKFMEENALIKIYPSKMIEITLKGKDFLKYLLHHSRKIDTGKRL
jgi:hypothetical protein